MMKTPVGRYVFWAAQMALYRMSETSATAYAWACKLRDRLGCATLTSKFRRQCDSVTPELPSERN